MFGLTALIAFPVLGCRQDDPAELEAAARASFATRRLDEAKDRLARLARLQPLSVSDRVLRAQIAHDRGLLDDAVRALDDPREPEPHKQSDAALLCAWRGWLEMQRHHFRAAEDNLKRTLALDPNRAASRRQLVDLYALQGRVTELAEQAENLAKSGPMDFSYLYVWTTGQHEGLDPAEQAKVLGDSVQADSNDQASRLALAECLRKLGQLDQAVAALSMVPMTNPDVRAIAACIALDRGDLSSAENLLAEASNANECAALAQLRGRLALLRDDAAAARKQFELTLKIEPKNREAAFGLGQALRLLELPQAAAPYLKAARDREHLDWLVQSARPSNRRNNPAILQEIGTACLSLGYREQALAWYRLALSLDPDNLELQHKTAQEIKKP